MGADLEEAEEEGRLEGRDRNMTNGHHTGRGDDEYND